MSRRAMAIRIAGVLAVVLVLIMVGRQPGVREALLDSLRWVEAQGAAGAAVFVLLYIAACVLFIPGSLLGLGAGAIYGVAQGTALVSLASTLGATAAFLLGRYFARGWVASRIAGNARFGAIDAAVGRDYVLASWAGMFPGTLLYVYLGSLAGHLATLGGAEKGSTPVRWAFTVLGFLATAAVTVIVSRLARKALNQKV
jgi:uncharacterized membrane protein YdjX (TVP38/TMEM64 family)